MVIPKPVWAVGFALEQTLRDATLAVFSFLILQRLQHIFNCYYLFCFGEYVELPRMFFARG
ncbi:MAG: hypothetical protein LBH59_00135 [Planctomycetaceae bacterium]|nr:hypothetical protein [Planctomycetaceae bacterium]